MYRRQSYRSRRSGGNIGGRKLLEVGDQEYLNVPNTLTSLGRYKREQQAGKSPWIRYLKAIQNILFDEGRGFKVKYGILLADPYIGDFYRNAPNKNVPENIAERAVVELDLFNFFSPYSESEQYEQDVENLRNIQLRD